MQNYDTVEYILLSMTIVTVIIFVTTTYYFIKEVNKLQKNGVK